jgi:transposase
MSHHHFWLSEAQFARLQPVLPNKPRGVPRVDDRRVISGIIHVVRGGLMWRDAPSVYGPPKTLCNGFIRWSRSVSSTASSPRWQAKARRRTR